MRDLSSWEPRVLSILRIMTALLFMERVPCAPGLEQRAQHRAGRAELLATPFARFEREIRDQLQRILNRPPDEQLRAVYREIMSSALALEKTLTIAYLGPEATFTHQAAIRRFGSSLRYGAQKTIADVLPENGCRPVAIS